MQISSRLHRFVAVLYVCADRGTQMRGLAADRAESEGRAFAEQHGLTVTEVVTDAYGDPHPTRRPGWLRVRALAEAGTVSQVLVRWPAAIAPDAAREFQGREIRWLESRGARVRYTWAPLANAAVR
ncbi:hypothetical protein Srut_56950 [Streptomyces rutgersensis]|nr:hypothetical protein Srut_56950 [Streptomyces rutgersensis]